VPSGSVEVRKSLSACAVAVRSRLRSVSVLGRFRSSFAIPPSSFG